MSNRYKFLFIFLTLSHIEARNGPANTVSINNIIDIPNKISAIQGLGSKKNDTKNEMNRMGNGEGTTTVMGTNYDPMIPDITHNIFGMNNTSDNDTSSENESNYVRKLGSIISQIPNKIFPNKTGDNNGIPGYGFISGTPNKIFGNNKTNSDNRTDFGSGITNFAAFATGFPDKIFGNGKSNSSNGLTNFAAMVPGILGNNDNINSGTGTIGGTSGNSENGTATENGSSSSGFPEIGYIPGVTNKKKCSSSSLSQLSHGVPNLFGTNSSESTNNNATLTGVGDHGEETVPDRPPLECVVSGALALLLRLSNRVGVCPLRFTRAQNGWLLDVSSPLAAIQRVFMTVLNLIMLTALIMDFCQLPERRIRVGETTLKACVWISDMVLMMVIASIAVYMGPSRMESLIQVQNQLQQVRIDLKMTEPSARSENLKSIAIIGILIWVLLILTADFYSYLELSIYEDKMWSIMCMYSSYYIGNVMGMLVGLQWSCMVLAVHATAIALNAELYRLRHANLEMEPSATLEDLLWPPKAERNNLVDGFNKPRKVKPGAESFTTLLQAQTTIRRLALSHERISELTRQMNTTNGIFLMVVLMSTFLRLVLTPYYLVLRLEYNERVLTDTLLQINWSIFHILVLLMTIEPCHWTQEQMERTQILLSQLIVHLAPKCERLSKELDQFAKQILLSNAKFMPLGVYPLARPLMATIFGGVTTYLVIIIQFQKISDQL